MNNTDVEELLVDCKNDLIAVEGIVVSLGYQSNIVSYLNKYAIIKACGTFEIAFKTLISDHCSRRVKRQVKNYLSKKVKSNSANPSYQNICNLLNDFDPQWRQDFKDKVNSHQNASKLKTSMESLVNARNTFAHGGDPNASISNVRDYFNDFYEVIIILDSVLC